MQGQCAPGLAPCRAVSFARNKSWRVAFVNQRMIKLIHEVTAVNAGPTTAKRMNLAEFLRPNYWGERLGRGVRNNPEAVSALG